MSAPSTEPALRRLRAVIEYDGTAFSGWQFQAGFRTVQGELERVISEMVSEPIKVRGASRTDAGVHARGQVVAFSTQQQRIRPYGFERGLNVRLPVDIAVREVTEAEVDWDPKRFARGKRYRYTIWNDRLPTAIDRGRTWWIRSPLSIEAMQQAAQSFVGTHDFEAFRSAGCAARHAVRTIYAVSLSRGPRSEVYVDVTGNAFCKNMVRVMVGTLREVGAARRAPGAIAVLLAGRDRNQAGMTAPPEGLCLEEVIYDDRLPPRPRDTRTGDQNEPPEDDE